MKNPFARHRAPTIDQDFVTRYWDLAGRVDKMEGHLDDRLDDLERRYKRSEQAERRLEGKKAEAAKPCPDDISGQHPALRALRQRRGGMV